jgi:Holliday junction resolvase RusA-like endonuclease
MMIEFTIPGVPMAQSRPRFSRQGAHVRAYESSRCVDSKAHIQQTVLMQHEEKYGKAPTPTDSPLHLVIEAYFPCPKSQHRKREPKPEMWKDNGPDLDNIAKHYMDALFNGILALDDRQICKLTVTKKQNAQGVGPFTVVRYTEVI